MHGISKTFPKGLSATGTCDPVGWKRRLDKQNDKGQRTMTINLISGGDAPFLCRFSVWTWRKKQLK